MAAGRRWGKSSIAVTLCLRTALEGGRTWWVGPTFPLAQIGWRILKRFSRQIPGVEIREADRLVILPGRGEVQVKSADNPDSLRGAGLDGVVIDEAAYVKEGPGRSPSGRRWPIDRDGLSSSRPRTA